MSEDESFFLKNYKHELNRMEPDEIKEHLILPAVERVISCLEGKSQVEAHRVAFISDTELIERLIGLQDETGSFEVRWSQSAGYWKAIRDLVREAGV